MELVLISYWFDLVGKVLLVELGVVWVYLKVNLYVFVRLWIFC